MKYWDFEEHLAAKMMFRVLLVDDVFLFRIVLVVSSEDRLLGLQDDIHMLRKLEVDL